MVTHGKIPVLHCLTLYLSQDLSGDVPVRVHPYMQATLRLDNRCPQGERRRTLTLRRRGPGRLYKHQAVVGELLCPF